MSRPIEIQVVTQAETKELEQIPDALEDVEKGLEKVEDAGKDTERALDKSFKDVEETSQRVGKEIDKDLTQALEEVGNEAKTTGRKVGRELDDGFDKAKRGADEFKDEAQQSSREAAASFTGDFEDVGDLIQETAANAFAGFGPMGAAAGIAAAAGIGALITSLQQAAEEAEKAKEEAIDLADSFKDAGKDWRVVDLAERLWEKMNQITNDKKWYEFWQDAPETFFEDVLKGAEDAGADLDPFFKGMVGGFEDITQAVEGYKAREAELNTEIAKLLGTNDPRLKGLREEKAAIADLRGELEEEAKKREYAERANEAYEDALKDSTPTIEEQQGAIDELNDAIQTNADNYLGARGAQREWIEAMEAADAALAENGATLDINTAAGRANAEALDAQAEAGLANIEAIKANGASQDELNEKVSATREELVNQAIEFGMTRDEANKYADELGLIPGLVKTDIEADNSDALAKTAAAKLKLDELAQMDINVPMRLGINPSEWQRQVNAAAARVIPPSVGINVRINQRQV